MSTNIDDYTISDLLSILNLNNPNETEIKAATDQMIARFRKEGKLDLVIFFEQVQEKLEQSFEYVEDEEANEQDNEKIQIGNWWQNEALTQDDTNQTRKYTIRKNKVDIFDNEHMIMNRDRLGINQTRALPVAQGEMNPTLRNVTTRVVNIDSQFRQNILPYDASNVAAPSSSTDYTLDLSETLNNVISIKLYSINIPYSWYTFDDTLGNTCFFLNGTEVKIDPGNYSPEELAAEILSEGPAELTDVSYNSNNGKMSFDVAYGADVSMIFFDIDGSWNCNSFCGPGAKINQNLGWNMGFRRPGPISYVDISGHFVGEAIVTTQYPKYLLLVVDDYNQNHLNKGLVSISDTNTKLSLPSYYSRDLSLNCATGSTIGYVSPSIPRQITQAQMYSLNEILANRRTEKTRAYGPTTSDVLALIPLNLNGIAVGSAITSFSTALQINKRTYFGPVDIERLRVRLTDDKGNTVNLHGGDWSFSIIAEQLYQY